MQESEAWKGPIAPSATTGAQLLARLERKLSPAERRIRQGAFAKAERFIFAARQAGGANAPVAKTFTVEGDRQQRRVDLEVITGKAFYP